MYSSSSGSGSGEDPAYEREIRAKSCVLLSPISPGLGSTPLVEDALPSFPLAGAGADDGTKKPRDEQPDGRPASRRVLGTRRSREARTVKRARDTTELSESEEELLLLVLPTGVTPWHERPIAHWSSLRPRPLPESEAPPMSRRRR